MAVENGEQVLPTDGFADFADPTEEEEMEYENKINEEQETPDIEAIHPPEEDIDIEEDEEQEVEIKEDDAEPEEDTADIEAEEAEETEEVEKDEPKPEYTKKEKFEQYSRSVQRRINKEIKQREYLRAQNEELRQRLDAVETKLQNDTESSESAILENRLRNATAIKEQLLEDGEYGRVAEVDNDIMQMKIYQSKLEDKKQQARSNQQQPPQQQSDYNDRNQIDEGVKIPDIQKEWMRGNEQYGKKEGYTKFVNDEYDTLVDEGYDPEDESLYIELDKRIGRQRPVAAVPKLKAVVPAPAPVAAPVAAPTKVRPKAAPTPATGQAQSRGSTSSLTESDKANMRNWGLDPNDIATRKEWLANRRKKA